MLRVEFHCHTIYSKDSLSRVADVLAACRARNIDRIVISDHNTIAGALQAKQLDPARVIVGEEIMTERGELLAAFVQEEIPKGLPVAEALRRLRQQGAFISVSHPFDRLRSGAWALADLQGLVGQVDAIEVFNARCFPPHFNRQAAAFASQHDLAGTVGSDAHTLAEVGRATLLLPEFADADGLRAVIRAGRPDTRRSGLAVRLGSRYAVLAKRIKGG